MKVRNTDVRCYVKLVENKFPLLAFATLIFDEWLEVKGFRIRQTDYPGRKMNNIWITPPVSPPNWNPLFSTTSKGKTDDERKSKRVELWYQLEDLIYEKYLETVAQKPIVFVQEPEIDIDEAIKELSDK